MKAKDSIEDLLKEQLNDAQTFSHSVGMKDKMWANIQNSIPAVPPATGVSATGSSSSATTGSASSATGKTIVSKISKIIIHNKFIVSGTSKVILATATVGTITTAGILMSEDKEPSSKIVEDKSVVENVEDVPVDKLADVEETYYVTPKEVFGKETTEMEEPDVLVDEEKVDVRKLLEDKRAEQVSPKEEVAMVEEAIVEEVEPITNDLSEKKSSDVDAQDVAGTEDVLSENIKTEEVDMGEDDSSDVVYVNKKVVVEQTVVEKVVKRRGRAKRRK